MGWELGSYNISLTRDGVNSQLFRSFNNGDIVYESHQDVVSVLPNDAAELAFSDKGNQSFSYGHKIFGVQFHPELVLMQEENLWIYIEVLLLIMINYMNQ